MKYSIVKLKFESAVRFGIKNLEDTSIICHSDTLFSAIYIEILKLYGEDIANNFKDKLNNKEVVLSSAMPFFYDIENEDTFLYIPKPIVNVDTNIVRVKEEENLSIKKKIKKIPYIRIIELDNFISGICNQNFDDVSMFLNYITKEQTFQKVNLQEEKNQIYTITSNIFNNEIIEEIDGKKEHSGINGYAGLYFIFSYNDSKDIEMLDKTLNSLQYTGIGGKRNIGYGKFNYEILKVEDGALSDDEREIIERIENSEKYDKKMLISLLSPSITEFEKLNVENISYSLIKRSGFIDSNTYSDNFNKKKDIFMFEEGSVFDENILGEIKDLRKEGTHSVYRNGVAMYIGVDLK